MTYAKKELLEEVIHIGWLASNEVLNIYQSPIEFSNKQDGSPLTQADLTSHQLISKKLHELLPEIIIISEENTNLDNIPWNNPKQFWLVDPLDGTKEFISRNGEFTVNIALIEEGKPILGVVCAPALGTLYAGLKGYGAFKMNQFGDKEEISVNDATDMGLYVVGSRSHSDQTAMEAYLEQKNIAQFVSVGSSLKFCHIAEGVAHLYPRLGRTMEWDTAAGHAILTAAGGTVELLNGNPLHYGKKDFENPHFIAKPQSLLFN